MKSLVVLALLAAAIAVASAERATFGLAAEDLPETEHMAGNLPDAFVRVSVYEPRKAAVEDLINVGTTSVAYHTENPNWPEAFTVDLTRGVNLKLRFHVYDRDVISRNDDLGFVEMDVDEFLDSRNTTIRAELPNGGFLLVTKTTTLKFKLSALNLPSKDRFWGIDDPSDPYVIFYYHPNANTTEQRLGHSVTLADNNSPNWPDTFEFKHYLPNKGQQWTFKIYDYDMLSYNEFIGEASVNVDDLVSKRNSNILSIGAKNIIASLTVNIIKE